MTRASDEQLQVIGAPISPMSVIACAGSGKTYTAVRRLAEIRRQLGDDRGRVALLSFSNVAVNTFRQEYRALVRSDFAGTAPDRIEIDTLDGFITSNVLRSHAARTMGCNRAPFLIAGTEPFLRNELFKFWAQPSGKSAFPVNPPDLDQIVVNFDAGGWTFHYRRKGALIPVTNGSAVVLRLGALGAYTHDLGRYWCHRTLTSQPTILRALVRRYPHILIDEAQDVVTVHQAIIELLLEAGCQVSLIGDPNQGIYEFAGATGAFLAEYGRRPGVRQLVLTRNYRSVPAILRLANRLSTRDDTAERAPPERTHGAFFVHYRSGEQEDLIAAFRTAVATADLMLERSAVLCRGHELADRLAGHQGAPGQGLVKTLAQAAILRDRKRDYLGAYKLVVACIVGLMANPPQGLAAMLTQPARSLEHRPLRQLVWSFTRSPTSGLPPATLSALTVWHPQLLERIDVLLGAIEQQHGIARTGNLGRKLARTGLTNTPIIAPADLVADPGSSIIRVDTVHKAKGESLDAVLYVANREHVEAMIAGVDTELGRIGYVAATRARDLLWVGVPHGALDDLRPALLARGFQEAGVAPPA